jgi:hypothetical protein
MWGVYGLDSFGSGQKLMTNSCEHDTESSDSINYFS